VEIGRRLRDARRNKGLSLKAAAVLSDGRWGTSTLGAYERGERAMAVGHLPELADLYGVSLTDLVPGAEKVIDLTDSSLARADVAAALEQAVDTLQELLEQVTQPQKT
jgi:transcriptional regulator with XRE-family HTH domain